jgi:hypothetical protein
MPRPTQFAIALLAPLVLLAGCQLMGGEPAEVVAARKEAEGKAIGGACRHAGRAIEDCFVMNKRADKAALFAGWREMNDYMRDNKIDALPPQGSPSAEVADKAEKADQTEKAEVAKKADELVPGESAGKKPQKSKKHDS